MVFDREGRVLAGLAGGDIVRIDPGTGERTILASTGGRPLGLEPARDGGVLVAHHDRGVLRVTPAGEVEVLVDSIDGEWLTFTSNVAEAADGSIYFTVSSRRWDLDHYLGDIIEHSCTGLLARRDPAGRVTVLRDDLKFANGVAVAPDGSAVLYAETGGYRVMRMWLDGPRAGRHEPLVDNLPGSPDNISIGSDGLLWVAMPAPRNALLDSLLPLPGLFRLLVWNTPAALRPKPARIGWVMAFDMDGRTVHDLRSTSDAYPFITGVAEHGGTLVAGSLNHDEIAVLELE